MSLSNLTAELSDSKNKFLKWAFYYSKPAILPIAVAIVPTLYHYSNNADKLTLLNLSRMLLFNIGLATVIYLVLLAFHRVPPTKAANAGLIFLIFFNVYGLAYRYLLHLDVIRIKHYTLLPLMLMLAIYVILFVSKLPASVSIDIWKHLTLIVGVLVLFNLFKISPVEIKKRQSDATPPPMTLPDGPRRAEGSPDIYYIVLDEFAGFQAMREYWKYEGVDDFVSFLEQRGFFVAEGSHASSKDTLHQLATRLNYQEYPEGNVSLQTYFNDVADNKVMRDLKSRGYTTVVFDETNMPYTSAKSIHADYLYEYGSRAVPESVKGEYGFYFDEFAELVVDNTMLYAFAENYRKSNPVVSQHSSMVSFTVEHIASQEVPSPKFVYVHLMLPHFPFIYDRNGDIIDRDQFTNWHYYLDNYIYSIQVAESMIANILSSADINNPPVIILQSDHGARNHRTAQAGSAVLPDYPEDFKTLILFALYIPGYDYANVPQDINPINTFPIVFNYLFDTNIPIVE
jgi:hypothetical protein